MIPSALAQLSQILPEKGVLGAQGASLNGKNIDAGMFSGVLQNVLSPQSTLNKSDLKGEQSLQDLSLEDLKALKNSLAADGKSQAEGQASGEEALLEITQIITVVYEELSVLSQSGPLEVGTGFDNLSSPEDLAAAYQKAGMSADEAKSRAARLSVMMLVMDDRISTENLMESLSSPKELGLAHDHRQAFINIEQTIDKFTLASAGSVSANLADAVRNGVALGDGSQLSAQNAEKASQLMAKLSTQMNGQNGGQNNGQSTHQNTQLGEAFGRMENMLTTLAGEASKNPEATDLAKKLQDMAGAVKRISQNVIQEGGLQKLEGQALIKSQSGGQEKTPADIKAEINKEQPLPRQPVSDGSSKGFDRSESLLNRGQGAGGENAAKNGNSNNGQTFASREPAMAEPQTPTYTVRPSASGGVEVVNPQTGDVIQTANPMQNAGTPSFSSNTGEVSATLTQSRGLEAALQARLSQQVNVHVRNLAGHGGGQINVGLNPPEMGRVQVRLEIMDGSVKGAITVQRPDVADSITRDIRALEDAFKDMGLELDQDGISVQLEEQAADQEKDNNNNQQEDSGTGLASTNSDVDASADGDSQENQGWRNPDRLLDVQA